MIIKSLQFKLGISVLIITMLILTLFGFYQYNIGYQEYEEDKLNEALFLAASRLSIGLRAPLYSFHEQGIKDVIFSEMANPVIEGVFIVEPWESENRYWYVRNKDDEIIVADEFLPKDKFKTASRKIIQDSEEIGEVHVFMTTKYMEKHLFNALILIIIETFLMGMLIFSLVILLLRMMVIRPIKQFKAASSEIAKGDLNSKINIKSNDELGDLALSFNQMTLDLKSSRAQLEKYNKELEKNVEERTGELNNKVNDLEKSKIATLNMMEDMDQTNTDLINARKKLEKANKEIAEFNKELENKVRERTLSLEEANKKIRNLLNIRTQFVNQVAHDLRTPLTPIIALLPVIKEKIKDRSEKEKIDVVLNNANYLSAIVRDTLDISKIDSGKAVFNFKPENIFEIIDSTIKNNSIIFKQNKIKTINQIKKDLPLVNVDKIRIIEVFENLVMNASRFMKDKKELTFDALVSEKFVTIKIKDTGTGITKDELERIFEEFYKVDSARHEHSSGLGLSISRRIIKTHGGKIWAESKGSGKGSTFYFTLPIYNKNKEEVKNDKNPSDR